MPPTHMQRQSLHQRGQSYDISRTPIHRHRHTGSAVSMHTNIGPIQGQQILREAQQQRLARPGQPSIQPRIDTSVAQQCGMFPQSSSHIPYDMMMNMPSPNGMVHYSHLQNMNMPTSANSRTSYMFDENTQHYFQPMHHMQDIQQMVPPHDRRLSQPDLRIQTGMRPYTPTHQIQTGEFGVLQVIFS